jgi:hypothetical protein
VSGDEQSGAFVNFHDIPARYRVASRDFPDDLIKLFVVRAMRPFDMSV